MTKFSIQGIINQKWDSAIKAIDIILLIIGITPWGMTQFIGCHHHRIEHAAFTMVFFNKPNLITTEKTVGEKMSIMCGEYQLRSMRIFGRIIKDLN